MSSTNPIKQESTTGTQLNAAAIATLQAENNKLVTELKTDKIAYEKLRLICEKARLDDNVGLTAFQLLKTRRDDLHVAMVEKEGTISLNKKQLAEKKLALNADLALSEAGYKWCQGESPNKRLKRA